MLLKHLINFSQKAPNKIAYISENKTLTFKETIEYIEQVAIFLKGKGCKRNSKIIISADNSLEWVFFYFAIQYIHSIPVILGKFFSRKYIQSIIRENKIKFIITDKKTNQNFLKNTVNITTDEIRKKEFLKKNFSNILNYCNTSSSSTSEILFTSGSTSKPKGVILTKKNSFYIAKQISKFVKVKINHKELLLLPLSHSFGLGRLKSQIITGNSLIILKNMNNIGKFLLSIKQYKANGFGIVPSTLEMIKRIDISFLKEIKTFLRFIELGSEEINIKTVKWLLKSFPNTNIYHHYGMTEASRAIFLKYNKDNIKNNLIGNPSFYSKISILNKKKTICKLNEIGEIAIKGPFVMKGYINNKSINKFTNYGFLTGDYGYKDKKGNVFLLGRKDSLVKINGINISLKEIEECINKYPYIKETLCLLKRNDSQNKIIYAKIVCKKIFKIIDLINFMQKRIENYKIPEKFEIVKKLPRSESNKLLRTIN